MYQISDSDSADSDRGIRYKTDSIRNKSSNSEPNSKRDSSRHDRSLRRERKSLHKDKHREKRKTRSSHRDRDRDKKKYREKDKVERDCRKSDEISCSAIAIEVIQSPTTSQQTQKEENEGTFLGPALPPHLMKKLEEDAHKRIENTGFERENNDSSSPIQIVPRLTFEETKSPINSEPSNTSENLSNLPPHESRVAVDCGKNYVYGPILPPAIPKANTDRATLSGDKIAGPILLRLPAYLEEKTFVPSSAESNKETKIIGPTLPPHLQKKVDDEDPVCAPSISTLQDQNSEKGIGPTLPPHLREKLTQDFESQNKDQEEEEIYGPVPVGASFSRSHIELEERALEMKIAQLEPQGQKEPTREEWMLELPAVKAANLGLGPRQFRSKAGPDFSDRSSWTDTPQDKEKKMIGKEEPKVDLQKEMELMEMKKRDKEQEALAKKIKRSKESLVEIHKKKLKANKDDSAPIERRPFNRETDLQVNRFDEAQKKAVLKKAQLLDNRFSSGESKFL